LLFNALILYKGFNKHGLIIFISLPHALHTKFAMTSLCFVPILMSFTCFAS